MRGLIDRRILVNYRVDAELLRGLLPAPFRPHLVQGFGVVGICLIRLAGLRPRFLPPFFGLGSENAAHRFAVEWDGDQGPETGVFVFRRDTNSRLVALSGGRVFPGRHHRASFTINENEVRFEIAMKSRDGWTFMEVAGSRRAELPADSIFGSLAGASDFFERGSLGYSPEGQDGAFEGMELRCRNWSVEALEVDHLRSSLFDDRSRFPEGSIALDHALLMRGVDHEWIDLGRLCCAAVPAKGSG